MQVVRAAVAHGEPVIDPPHIQQLEYEGELAVAIGRRCRNGCREEARSAILACPILNDLSGRDVQRVEKQCVRARRFDTSAATGRWWPRRWIPATCNW